MFFLGALSTALVASASGECSQLRIRGKSQFRNVRVIETNGQLRVQGSLRDDSSRAVSGALVTTSDSLERCRDGSDTTGKEGEFCFVSSTRGGTTKLTFDGNDYFGPSEFAVQLAVKPLAMEVAIQLTSPRLRLAQERQAIAITITGDLEPREPFSVQLFVSRNQGDAVGIDEPLSVSAEAPAVFSVASSSLGEAGGAHLSARVSRGGTQVGEHQLPVILVGQVQMSWRSVPIEARPSDGFDSVVSLVSEHGAVNSGFVETRVGDVVVGLGTIKAGEASIRSRFIPQRANSVNLDAHYVPSEAWWESGPYLRQAITVLPPSPWQHVPWLVLGLLATMWVIRSWRRPPSQKDRARPETQKAPRASVDVIQADPRAEGWTGQVVDAHTRQPVSGAQIHLLVPSIDGSAHPKTITDAQGGFSLASPDSLPEGARLKITARTHSALQQPVPKRGALCIRVTARRRTLLSQLTTWATGMGRPWEKGSETTPASVAQTAELYGKDSIQSWASTLEEAVYGPTELSEEKELDVVQLTPPLDRSDPHRR